MSNNTAPASRRGSLLPPNLNNEHMNGSRRNSRAAIEKLPPSLMRWEILNRVLAFAMKGDWPAVDQHLSMVEKNNLENLPDFIFREDEVLPFTRFVTLIIE